MFSTQRTAGFVADALRAFHALPVLVAPAWVHEHASGLVNVGCLASGATQAREQVQKEAKQRAAAEVEADKAEARELTASSSDVMPPLEEPMTTPAVLILSEVSPASEAASSAAIAARSTKRS